MSFFYVTLFIWSARPLRPRGARNVNVTRRGLPEVAILGGLTILSVLRPKSAPGPSDRLLQDAEDARQAVKGSTRDKLQQALRKLSMVEAQLEAAKGDQLDYPLRLVILYYI